MFTLKILVQIALSLIAAVALFGKTFRNNNLTKLGWVLLLLVIVAGLANTIALFVERSQEQKEELVKINSKEIIYARILGDVEVLKRAISWKKYDIFAENDSDFKYKRAVAKFRNPSPAELRNIDNRVIKPMKLGARKLASAYENNKLYISFHDSDSLKHFLASLKATNLVEIVSNYRVSSEGDFSQYLSQNDIGQDQLSYLFLSLAALDQEIKKSKAENDSEFYKIRPECESPEKAPVIMSCL